MTLTVTDVKRIADLAYIEIDHGEAEAVLTQFTGIFNLIETMQSIDTSSVDPMSHAQSVTQRLRDDEPVAADQFLRRHEETQRRSREAGHERGRGHRGHSRREKGDSSPLRQLSAAQVAPAPGATEESWTRQ